MTKVSTGEVWQGDKAKKLGLIDEIATSDDYLLNLSEKFKLLEIQYFEKKPLSAKFASLIETVLEKSVYKILDILNKNRFIN